MKKRFSARTLILAGSLLLQLSALCFYSHGAAGDVDLSFDPGSGVNGDVGVVALQLDGKVIIAGNFTTVRGLLRRGLARLNTDGTGDSTFTADFPFGGYALALQPDGKVLVGHSSGVTRLRPNGSPDPSFSVTVPSSYETDGIYSLAVQPDGKVLLAGHFQGVNGVDRSGIARVNADGSLDGSFVVGIQVVWVSALALQPDGKVLVRGYLKVNGAERALVRLNANGSLDNSFNADAQRAGFPYDILTLQPDGKILVQREYDHGHRLFRLNGDGTLDGSFNQDAAVYGLYSIVLLPDGRLLAAAYLTVNQVDYPRIVRLNANGTLDGSFDSGRDGLDSAVWAVVLQSDGKVLFAGDFTTVNGAIRKRMARLEADGSLDLSFDPGAEINGAQASDVLSIVAQPDGKVLIGGWFESVQGVTRNRMARLNGNGTLDTTFNPGTGAGYSIVHTIALQSDGKVLIGGNFSTFNGPERNGIARLHPDGGLDGSFAPDLATIPHPDDCPPGYSCGQYIEVIAVRAQADGKVVIGGLFLTYVSGDIFDAYSRTFLARLNADGSRDTTFAPAIGNSSSDILRALAVQPDGKVVLVSGSGIIRINANGTLDNGFNAGTGVPGLTSVALQPDGRVLIGGGFPANQVARLNADGSLDNSFNLDTRVNANLLSIMLQPDGKVLIGGGITIANSPILVARLNSNGSLDESFNLPSGNGVQSMALQPDGNVLIGGHFLTVDGAVRPQVARLYGDAFVLPSVNIARSNAFVTVSWPLSASGFVLDQSPAITGGWSQVSFPYTTNGTVVSVSVPTPGGNKFYRLRKP